MLRKFGDFADRQIRKYLTAALLCLGLALTAVFAKLYSDLQFAGLIIAALAIVFFKASLRCWSNWFVGNGVRRRSLRLSKLSPTIMLS